MELYRCLRVFPVVALATAGLIAVAGRPSPMDAGGAAWSPPDCATRPPEPTLVVRGSGLAGGAAWFRLEPVLDGTGTLAGQRLVVGSGGGVARWIALHAEASASSSRDGTVLVADDDGSRSRLFAVDALRGCSSAIGSTPDVVRSAVAAPDGSVVEHRVDRVTREDRGVWRRFAGHVARRILPGLRAADPYGRTFSTLLRVEDDGRVVASSCGLQACRVRVLDADGRVRMVERTGPAVGLVGDGVVVREACTGLPCPVLLLPLDGQGRARVLVDAAGDASLAAPGRLVFVGADGMTHRLDVPALSSDAAESVR